MGRFDLASALTIDCHTGLASMVTPDSTAQYIMVNTRRRATSTHIQDIK